MVDVSWLPDRHLGVAATLAHVDEVIMAMSDIMFKYQTGAPGIVNLREVKDGTWSHLVVDSVKPIPPKVPL